MFNFADLFDWLNRRSKDKSASISRYLFIGLVSMGSVANAEYYWRLQGPFMGAPNTANHYNGPSMACQAVDLSRYDVCGNPDCNKYTFVFSHLKANPQFPGHPVSFKCFFKRTYTYKDALKNIKVRVDDWNPSVAARIGNFCPLNSTYNPTSGECTDDKGKGGPPGPSCKAGNYGPPPFAGDPINISNGNSIQTETDFQGRGVSTLNFVRTYNSLDGLWRHNHSTYLRLDALALNTLALVMADGRESFFTLSGSTVTASPTELGQLTKTGTGRK
ncbi:MAG: DUF6531 domain-containing protein [Pseudomonas sp.]|uniref:DUF6531 domain-containing protein n=1 Tax=Pseudomonas sp. TaxID=306 RepID=UPI003BB5D8D0